MSSGVVPQFHQANQLARPVVVAPVAEHHVRHGIVRQRVQQGGIVAADEDAKVPRLRETEHVVEQAFLRDIAPALYLTAPTARRVNAIPPSFLRVHSTTTPNV